MATVICKVGANVILKFWCDFISAALLWRVEWSVRNAVEAKCWTERLQ